MDAWWIMRVRSGRRESSTKKIDEHEFLQLKEKLFGWKSNLFRDLPESKLIKDFE
jgi:hypothetical protein